MSSQGNGNPFRRLFEAPNEGAEKPSALLNLFGKGAGKTATPDDEPPPNCAVAFDPDHVFWALRDIPVREAVKSFLICGAPGSGKTKSIQLFLQSIAPRIIPTEGAPPEQLIMFDAKGDALPMLASMGLRPELDNFYILNPFDARCAVWNLGEAVDEPGADDALAALLVPEDQNSSAPYFAQSARAVVKSVIQSLQAIAGADWTLRDLLCALGSADNIRRVTSRFSPAKTKVHAYLNDDKHFPGILSSIAAKVGRFDSVAALWAKTRSARPFVIKDFLKKPGVLVLANDPVLSESIWPFNAIILKTLTNHILRQAETFMPRHWFILDEFRAMEKVDCIHSLLNRGRSKGASVTLGIQTIEGINQVYGQNAASDIMAMCAYKTFLHAGSFQTAEWAERHFSKVRQMEESYSQGNGQSSVSRALHERSLFLASTFLNLAFPEAGKTFESISDVPCLGETLISQRPFDDVLSWCLDPAKIATVAPYDAPYAHDLHPWEAEEEARFCDGKEVTRQVTPKDPTKEPDSAEAPVKKEDGGNAPEPEIGGPSIGDLPNIKSIQPPPPRA